MDDAPAQLPAPIDRVAPTPATGAIDPIESFVESWLAGRPATTALAYRKDLAHFAAFLATTRSAAVGMLLGNGQGPATAIALDYRARMTELGLSPATIGRRLSALRSLAARASEVGLVPWSLRVKSPKSEKYRDTRGPGHRGIVAMARAAGEAAADSAMGRRDLAIFRLCYERVMRRSTVNGIDLADVDLDPENPSVAVIGKGKREKERKTISRPAALALAAWIEARGDEPGPLFVRLDRAAGDGPPRRMDPASINRITKRLGRRAGVARGANAHGLRHAGITQALELSRGDLVAVAKLSDHADVRTIMIYDDRRTDEGGRLSRMLGEDLG